MDKKKLIKMPPLKDYHSRQEWEAACWQKILNSKELLSLLITSYERHDLVKRAIAIDRLMIGKTYQQIAEELLISPQTISVIKKAIKEKVYRSYPARKERRKKEYSVDERPIKRKRPKGRPRRTKYGTIYIPY